MIRRIEDTLAFPEFDNHAAVYEILGGNKTLGYIAIHRQNADIPSFGATRILSYQEKQEALRDALRLSALMTAKSGGAGLPYGGAKAVLIAPSDFTELDMLHDEFLGAVNELSGTFITGADVGVSPEDVAMWKRRSQYIVGTEVDPVRYTSAGILHALRATFKYLYSDPSIAGRSVAIQGLGKIGGTLAKHLIELDAKVFGADIDPRTVFHVKSQLPEITIVPPEEILSLPVDIISPNALYGAINDEIIPQIQARGIVGGANNQLARPELAKELYDRGIIYVPDFIVNAGGLISVTAEYEHSIDDTILLKRIAGIEDRVYSYLQANAPSVKKELV